MKKYEKILIILVIAWFIGNLMTPLFLSATSHAMSSSSTMGQKTYYHALSVVYGYVHMLPQFLIAIWMFIDAKKKNLNKWIWGVAGLGLGINAAVLYVALQILEAILQKNENGSQQAVPGYPPQCVGSPEP